ncbi:MAG TPA: hypothetical protein VFW73_09220 [Lacipirellulaceae bacterium]|nr:hypothetical protein [Lacipirellulaceae bacterium]
MKRIHPNASRAATCATSCAMFALALGLGGCRSTSSGVTNPFLAPDRVPPPSTHVLLPGQAQPYYQGDPLPAVQARSNAPAGGIAAGRPAQQTSTDALSSTGRTLAWTAPGGSSIPTAATSPPPPVAAQPAAPPVVASNEAPVAVPTDSDPLRFSLPASTQPATLAPKVAIAPPPAVRTIQPAVARSAPPVQLAAYNSPVPGNPPPAPPTVAPPPQINSPWRAPQIPSTTAQPNYAAQPNAMQAIASAPVYLPSPPIAPTAQTQVAIPVNTMPVTLRPVASPTETGDTIPRIRMPSYVAQQTTASDGFRPRTSMQ